MPWVWRGQVGLRRLVSGHAGPRSRRTVTDDQSLTVSLDSDAFDSDTRFLTGHPSSLLESGAGAAAAAATESLPGTSGGGMLLVGNDCSAGAMTAASVDGDCRGWRASRAACFGAAAVAEGG